MKTVLRLENITADNFDAAIGLKVRPDQEHLVAPVVKSLAEAYVHPGTAWPRLILDGDRPVQSVAAEIRRRGGTRLTTTWHPGGNGPEGFYLGLGFRPTGETSGDQRVGELDLT